MDEFAPYREENSVNDRNARGPFYTSMRKLIGMDIIELLASSNDWSSTSWAVVRA